MIHCREQWVPGEMLVLLLEAWELLVACLNQDRFKYNLLKWKL
jgi:hypothetical protein